LDELDAIDRDRRRLDDELSTVRALTAFIDPGCELRNAAFVAIAGRQSPCPQDGRSVAPEPAPADAHRQAIRPRCLRRLKAARPERLSRR